MERKTRSLPFPIGTGYTNYITIRPGFPDDVGHIATNGGVVLGSQVTDSENHHWPSIGSDVGGDFFTQKKWVEGEIQNVSSYATQVLGLQGKWYTAWEWHGPVFPVKPPFERYFPPAMNSSSTELNKFGAEAIARSSPTNSLVNLGTLLGELLRDGLPKLSLEAWEGVSLSAVKAGGDYLNLQYGWMPLVNDIKNVARAAADLNGVIRQIRRDAGRPVRRRYSFPTIRSTTVMTSAEPTNPYPYVVGGASFLQLASAPVGGLEQVRTVIQDRWFSGQFVYHLPSDWKQWEAMDTSVSKLGQIFSVDLDPVTLWNLTPWSWAADWFSNVGDVLSNVSAWGHYGQVLRYGYLMEHTLVKDTFTRVSSGPWFKNQGPRSVSPSASFVTETKVRRKANPYGFGLSWDGLNAFQQSILAALGITRSGR